MPSSPHVRVTRVAARTRSASSSRRSRLTGCLRARQSTRSGGLLVDQILFGLVGRVRASCAESARDEIVAFGWREWVASGTPALGERLECPRVDEEFEISAAPCGDV